MGISLTVIVDSDTYCKKHFPTLFPIFFRITFIVNDKIPKTCKHIMLSYLATGVMCIIYRASVESVAQTR